MALSVSRKYGPEAQNRRGGAPKGGRACVQARAAAPDCAAEVSKTAPFGALPPSLEEVAFGLSPMRGAARDRATGEWRMANGKSRTGLQFRSLPIRYSPLVFRMFIPRPHASVIELSQRASSVRLLTRTTRNAMSRPLAICLGAAIACA